MNFQSADLSGAANGRSVAQLPPVTWRLVLLCVCFAVCLAGLAGGMLTRVKDEWKILQRIEWYEQASSFAGIEPAAGWQYRHLGMHERHGTPSSENDRKQPALNLFHGAAILYAAMALLVFYRGWAALQPLGRIIPETPRGLAGLLPPAMAVGMILVPVAGLFRLVPFHVNLTAFGQAAAELSSIRYQGPSKKLVLAVFTSLFVLPLVLVACDLAALIFLKGMFYAWYRVAAGCFAWMSWGALYGLHFIMTVQIEHMADAQWRAWKAGLFDGADVPLPEAVQGP